MVEADFQRVKAKVPKVDRDGTAVTNATLGSGGVRRDDGTISAMAYDLELVEDDDEFATAADKPTLPRETPAWVEEASREVGAAIGAALGELLVEVVVPKTWVWLHDRAAPAVGGKLSGLAKRVRPSSHREVDNAPSGAIPQLLAALPEDGVGVSVTEPRVSMTSSQWRDGFQMWLAVASFEDALRRILANAQLEDADDAVAELKKGIEQMTQEQRSAIANRMLHLGNAILDEVTSARLAAIFGAQIVDGRHEAAGQIDRRGEPHD